MKIKVQGKTYEVSDEFKNLSKADQQRVLQNIVSQETISGQQANTRRPEEIGDIKGLSRAALGQGLLFGFGDELEAGVRSGFGLLGDYGDKVKDVRQEIADYQALNPGKSISAEIGGAVVPSVIAGIFSGGTGTAAGGAATTARIASRAPSVARQFGQGAKIGAGYGGVYGVGTGQSEDGANIGQIAYDRAMSGLKGAALGGTVGGVMQPAIGGGIRGINKVRDMANQAGILGGKSADEAAEKFANRKVLGALNQDDKFTVGGGLKGLDDQADDLPKVIADTGEAAGRQGYAVTSISNPSNNKTVDTLIGRQQDQAMRIVRNTQKALKTDPDKIGINYIDDLASQQSIQARANYPEAYKQTINVGKFENFFGNRAYTNLLNDAAKRAQKILQAEGKDVPDLAAILSDKGKTYFGSYKDFLNQDLSTEFFHALKMGMDDIIDAGTKVNAIGQTEVTKYAQKVIKTKNAFDKVIRDNNSTYAKANDAFSDKARLLNVFKDGTNVNKMDIRSIQNKFEKMNPGEKEAFKNGVISHFIELAEKSQVNANFVNKIFGSTKNQELFKTIMDAKTYKKFQDYIKRETAASKTLKDTLQGSPTELRIQAKRELGEGGGEALVQAGNRGISGNLAYFGGKALNRLGGVDANRAAKIADKLFETDPARQKIILNELAKENDAMAKEVARILQLSNKGAGVVGGPFAVGVVSDPNNPNRR